MEKLIIKIPKKKIIIEVAESDYSEEITWHEISKIISEKGKGWRLPDVNELEIIFQTVQKLNTHNFKFECYWSSSEFYSNFQYFQTTYVISFIAYYYNFPKKYSNYIVKSKKNAIRLVKTINN